LQNPGSDRGADGAAAVWLPELVQNAFDVRADCLLADRKLTGDAAIGVVAGQ
jgi:hypothetical protein